MQSTFLKEIKAKRFLLFVQFKRQPNSLLTEAVKIAHQLARPSELRVDTTY